VEGPGEMWIVAYEQHLRKYGVVERRRGGGGEVRGP